MQTGDPAPRFPPSAKREHGRRLVEVSHIFFAVGTEADRRSIREQRAEGLALALLLQLQRAQNAIEHDQSATGTLQRLTCVCDDISGLEQLQLRALPDLAVEYDAAVWQSALRAADEWFAVHHQAQGVAHEVGRCVGAVNAERLRVCLYGGHGIEAAYRALGLVHFSSG